jgi:hypothetical protein
MHNASLCIVTPSGVLNIAFGVTGQAATQGASVQWLHSTGITQCFVFGKVPSVFMTKSAQLWLWPLARVRVLFSALQANVQHPQPTHFCKLMTIPSLAIFSLLQLVVTEFRLSPP